MSGESVLSTPYAKKEIAWLLPAAIAASAGISALAGTDSARRQQKNVAATNEANLQIARETNQANLDLYREQYADSMKAWQAENEYNSPLAQSSRLRAAGLNPALYFSGNNTAGSVSLPSAAPMQGATMQSTPVEAYNDSFLANLSSQLPDIAQSLNAYEDYRSRQIDNMTKKAYNEQQLHLLRSQIDKQLSDAKLSLSQRDKLLSEKNNIDFMFKLNQSTYDDQVKLSKLNNQYIDTQMTVLRDTNARDAAKSAIEQLELASKVRLNDAQRQSVNTMAQLAVNADFRSRTQHDMDMTLKKLDVALHSANLSDTQNKAAFNAVMREMEKYHEELKDASLLNRFVERAFGLGFRDVGNALRSLLSPK